MKTGGKSYYVNHITVSPNVGFSTKETPNNEHTKGSIKIKNASLKIINNEAFIGEKNENNNN